MKEYVEPKLNIKMFADFSSIYTGANDIVVGSKNSPTNPEEIIEYE